MQQQFARAGINFGLGLGSAQQALGIFGRSLHLPLLRINNKRLPGSKRVGASRLNTQSHGGGFAACQRFGHSGLRRQQCRGQRGAAALALQPIGLGIQTQGLPHQGLQLLQTQYGTGEQPCSFGVRQRLGIQWSLLGPWGCGGQLG